MVPDLLFSLGMRPKRLMGEMRHYLPARWVVVTITLVLSGLPGLASARSQDPPPPPPPPSQQPPPPATDPKTAPPQASAAVPDQNLDRIKRALGKEPRITFDEGQVRFYVEVLAKLPRIEEIIGKYDLMNGPTRRGAPMTHQEYLNMVTPRELYGSAGIKPAEVLQFALVNWLGQAFVRKVVNDLRNASSEREIQEIRDRIDRELAAIRGRSGR